MQWILITQLEQIPTTQMKEDLIQMEATRCTHSPNIMSRTITITRERTNTKDNTHLNLDCYPMKWESAPKETSELIPTLLLIFSNKVSTMWRLLAEGKLFPLLKIWLTCSGRKWEIANSKWDSLQHWTRRDTFVMKCMWWWAKIHLKLSLEILILSISQATTIKGDHKV